jgi:hypothetical protein
MTEQRQKLLSGGVSMIVIILLLVITTILSIQQYNLLSRLDKMQDNTRLDVDDLASRLDKMQDNTRLDVPDDLALRLGKMMEVRTKAIYRIGLLKYLAIQSAIDKEDSNTKYWQAQNAYANLSASYNGCLTEIIAQLGFRNKVTQINCLPEGNVSKEILLDNENVFLKSTEEGIKPSEQIIRLASDGTVSSFIDPHNDTDGSNKQSPLLKRYNFFDKVSSDRLEQEIKLMEIRRQSQSSIVNLLESFKWPDIGVIRPQPIAVSHSSAKQPTDEKKPSFDWCETKVLEKYLTTNPSDEHHIENDDLYGLLSELNKTGVCK